MLTMVFETNAPGWAVQGLKELIAMAVEKQYGEIKCVGVFEGTFDELQKRSETE